MMDKPRFLLYPCIVPGKNDSEGEAMEIGTKLKNARSAAKLTQEQAAEALGVSRQTVSSWENEKTYPDIVSVIRMSDLYSVSLDHLLKEEPEVKQSYTQFLSDSTDAVKSRDRLARIVLTAALLLCWAVVEAVFFLFARGAETAACNIVFRAVLLPAVTAAVTFIAGKNGFWGKAAWLLIPLCAVLFLLVPRVSVTVTGTDVWRAFVWPDLRYLPIGAAVALLGLGSGKLLRAGRSRAED